jgi:hypothetical protein
MFVGVFVQIDQNRYRYRLIYTRARALFLLLFVEFSIFNQKV